MILVYRHCSSLCSNCCVDLKRTDDEGGDAERPHAAGLRVLLLHARDIARQVLYAHLLVQRQPVALRLHPRCDVQWRRQRILISRTA